MPPQPQRQRVKPPVAQHHSPGVAPPPQASRHVVSRIEHALRVGRPAGVEHLVAHPAPVEAQLVVAQAAHINPGAANLLFDHKLLAQQRRRIVREQLRLRKRRGPPARNPVRLPIRRRQQAHLPPRRLTVPRGPPVAIPGAHCPIDPLARAQRAPAIDDMHRLTRGHLAAVPQIRPALRQQLRAGGGQHAISRLPLPAFRRLQPPAQPRLRSINPQRVGAVLAPQALRMKSSRPPGRSRDGKGE